jgi:hypothetical protein
MIVPVRTARNCNGIAVKMATARRHFSVRILLHRMEKNKKAHKVI